jgi:carboxypeptidase Q
MSTSIHRWHSSAATAAVVLVLFSTPAHPQDRVDHAMIEQIRVEGLERSRAEELFVTLTDVIGPRLSGSPAYRQAAEWSRDQLTGFGLANARFEPFEFGRGWSLEEVSVELVAPRYMPLIGYAEAWSPSTAGVVTGRPMYIGDLTAAEIEGIGERLRGAIVLARAPQEVFTRADRPQPTEADGSVRTGAPQRAPGETGAGATPHGELRSLLQRFGAAAMLAPSRGEHGTVFVLGNRNTASDAVPSFVLAAEHYNMLVRMVEEEAPVELRLQIAARYHEDDLTIPNVIAEIPGTDPALRDQIVLVGAHLDSWHTGTGAADNADGVVVAMEAMRILRALGADARRTIRIALWGGEEQGLLGSEAYVERHLSGADSVAARAGLSVYLNDDPGAGQTYGFYMQGNEAAKALFDTWVEPLRDLGVRRNVILGIPSTDHLSFLAVGVPGYTAIKDYTNYDIRMHHTNQDTGDRLNVDDLRQSAIVLATVAWHAAMLDQVIPRQ